MHIGPVPVSLARNGHAFRLPLWVSRPAVVSHSPRCCCEGPMDSMLCYVVGAKLKLCCCCVCMKQSDQSRCSLSKPDGSHAPLTRQRSAYRGYVQRPPHTATRACLLMKTKQAASEQITRLCHPTATASVFVVHTISTGPLPRKYQVAWSPLRRSTCASVRSKDIASRRRRKEDGARPRFR